MITSIVHAVLTQSKILQVYEEATCNYAITGVAIPVVNSTTAPLQPIP